MVNKENCLLLTFPWPHKIRIRELSKLTCFRIQLKSMAGYTLERAKYVELKACDSVAQSEKVLFLNIN